MYKIVRTVYQQCLTCQVHYPGKTVLPLEASHRNSCIEYLQMVFIQLKPSTGYQYFLDVICTFFTYVEDFSCCKADVLTVAQKLVETVFATWDIPSTIASD